MVNLGILPTCKLQKSVRVRITIPTPKAEDNDDGASESC